MVPESKQSLFDDAVKCYNTAYLSILETAAEGTYSRLLHSCLRLKELYDTIIKLTDNVTLKAIPYPFTFRPSDDLLMQYGFRGEQIDNIRRFLIYVRKTEGKEIEDCLSDGCAIGFDRIPQKIRGMGE